MTASTSSGTNTVGAPYNISFSATPYSANSTGYGQTQDGYGQYPKHAVGQSTPYTAGPSNSQYTANTGNLDGVLC